MIIRKATEKDLNILNELQIGLAKYERKIVPISLDPESVREKYYKNYQKKIKNRNCVFFIAEEKGKTVGYIFGKIEEPEHYYIYKKRGFIVDAFVLEKYRGKGIGEKLARRLMAWFRSRGIKWYRVSAYVKNKPGVKFWKKMGFKDYVIWLDKINE